MTDTKHFPEIDLGHAFKRERKRTTVNPVVNEKTLLVELSDPRPGALFTLSEGQYVLLINRTGTLLESMMGEHPGGELRFNRRIFFEAAGTVEGKTT